MRQSWSRFCAWISGRRDISGDLAAEMREHLQMEIEARIDRGMAPQEARRVAAREFGNATALAESARDTWGFPSLESFLHDIRYGLRGLRRSPGFAAVVVLTFALGIGVNTTVFGVVRSVLLKPLPYPASDRLVWFGESAGKAEGISVSWGNFVAWRGGNRTFDEMAAFQFTSRTLTGRGEPLVAPGITVTSSYFPLLGMRPLLGRLFGPDDDRAGAPPVIVLNHRFWSGALGADPQVVGSTLTLNGNPFAVIGVAAPLWEPWEADYYLPLTPIAGNPADRRQHGSIRMLGRLKAGVTVASARGDLDGIMRRLADVDPGPENDHRSFGRLMSERVFGWMRGTLAVLMGAAGLILLIACANVASLLLARNAARTGELALRTAIGAGRLRLLRQLLTETVVIAAAGGLAGIGLAYATLRLLLAVAPDDIPRLAQSSLDPSVMLFACAVSAGAGLIAAIAPILAAGKPDLAEAMKQGARAAGGSRHRQRFRNVLVVAEVALTFVLAFGSGILLRSLIAAQTADPGFDSRHALSFTVQLPGRAYRTPDAIVQFHDRLLDHVRRIPGVLDASSVFCLPGAGDCGDWFYSIPGRPVPPRTEVPLTLVNTADAGYFRLMRIPIRQGREFNQMDRPGGPQVVVVNETFARKWWPNEPAIGKQIKFGGPYRDGPLLEIVGVAGDIRQFGLDSQPEPELYWPYAQQRQGAMSIVVRTAGPPNRIAAAVRSTLAALDPNLPAQKLGLIDDSLGAGLARRRFITLLLTIFAALAMALAAIGIYGLLSYWVASREPEIAIRLAIGAHPSTIVRWTSLQALRLASIGIALGVAGALFAARAIEDLVFGVAPRSPATLAAAGIAVVALALAAAAPPAWRAARVDAARRLHCA